MNRNEESKYSELDTIETPRSKWKRNFTHKTTFNAGQLVPFLLDMDIIPGTTIKNRTSLLLRMTTPLNPVMDNAYLDTYYFKCSKFWYWNHWRAMMGENELGAWTQQIEYTEPQIESNTTYPYSVNDLATYIGVPMGINKLSYSKIAINAYIDVWNQWFRDQNLQAPIALDKTDANVSADGTISTGCGLLPVQKYHDYFTSCLPEPQKGSPVSMPLGTEAPIVYGDYKTTGYNYLGANFTSTQAANVKGKQVATVNINNSSMAAPTSGYLNTGATYSAIPIMADLTQATAATINALRLATQTQRILEKDARFGTRYREILRGHFGVSPADESIMTPEYLGGKRIPINMETVLQNSSTDSTSPLGYTGAMSITIDTNEDFTKSFTKDDILIGVCCIRTDHTYQQGIRPALTRTRRLDRYWPALAHIGNQPVYNREIYAQGATVLNNDSKPVDNDVFGYKEAWQEYITPVNRISGELLSTYSNSLDVWHYGDDYNSLPVLSDQWIRETTNNIDRTIAVQSSLQNQFIADFYVEQIVAAPIPMNRTPGLLDHF